MMMTMMKSKPNRITKFLDPVSGILDRDDEILISTNIQVDGPCTTLHPPMKFIIFHSLLGEIHCKVSAYALTAKNPKEQTTKFKMLLST